MKKPIFFITLLLISCNIRYAYTQKPDNHQKKVHIADDSTIYWNKALPFYVHLSTSPDPDAKKYRMKSKASAEFADPCYFDTEGVNYIRTKWAVDPETKKYDQPKHEVMWEIYADSKPPDISLNITNTKKYHHNNTWYYSKGGKLKINTSDEVSGTEEVYIALNNGNYKTYKNPVKLNEEKAYTVDYYAVDYVGNVSTPKSWKFKVDGRAPVTTHQVKGAKHKNILGKNAKITLKAKEEGSGLFYTNYKIDQGQYANYKNVLYLSWLPEGTHTLTYYSADNLKNEEQKKTYKFYIDKSAPTVSSEIIGDVFTANGKEYSSGRSRLKLFAIDNKAGVKAIKYKIGNDEWKTYTRPIQLKSDGGKLNISYYAIDSVGNKSAGSGKSGMGIKSPYMDLSGPKLSYNFEGPFQKRRDSIFISPKTQIHLKGHDEESGFDKITYKIGDGSFKAYDKAFSIQEPGRHTIFFQGYDKVSNSTNKSFDINIDKNGPEIHTHFGIKSNKKEADGNKSIPIYPSSTVLFLSATDDKAGYHKIYYSLNNGPDKLYTSKISNFKSGQKHRLKIKAIDKLGNTKEKTLAFGIE